MEPTVKLVTATEYPLETLFTLWEASRDDGHLPYEGDVVELAANRLTSPSVDAAVVELFRSLWDADIPLLENVSFTFLLDGVSVSLREQLVRHRIGTKVGDRVGMDYAPDLHDSTWWAQSMRLLDMRTFAVNGAYHIPASIAADKGLLDVYQHHMLKTAETYERLVEAGVPAEEARQVIPLGVTHRISWTVNLAALKHIISKRSCWILQLGLWGPVVRGISQALAQAHPEIQGLLCSPPCWAGGRFTGCKFAVDNERRSCGEDALPPCPLWVGHERVDAESDVWLVEGCLMRCPTTDLGVQYGSMWSNYRALWPETIPMPFSEVVF